MTDTSKFVFTAQLTNVLRETFVGPPGPWTYFTDNRPGVGLLSTLQGTTADVASSASRPDSSTIAGHVAHLVTSLTQSGELLRKPTGLRDRPKSDWTVSSVSESSWDQLRKELAKEYERFLRSILEKSDWDEDSLGAAIGAAAHCAYHLGAIRQRLASSGKLKT